MCTDNVPDIALSADNNAHMLYTLLYARHHSKCFSVFSFNLQKNFLFFTQGTSGTEQLIDFFKIILQVVESKYNPLPQILT